MPKLSIVKIGGAVIEDPKKLAVFLADFAALDGHKILVHGGGKKASLWAEKLGIPVQMKDGRRVTDAATLELITGIYGGQLNKNIVALLQGMGCNALGLSGADGNAIQAIKRPVKAIDYGFVGDVSQVNTALFNSLIEQDISPVCCAITHDGRGQLFNTNADTIAAEIGKAMAAHFDTVLYYCFELKGVLNDFEDKESVIQKIDSKTYKELLHTGTISAGMLPKLENCFDALQMGVAEVRIGNTSLFSEENNLFTSIAL